MLKLVRLALTAAILAAVAVRLRRRARMPARPPAPPRAAQGPAAWWPGRPVRSRPVWPVWAAVAGVVAVVLVVALLPYEDTSGARLQAQRERHSALVAAAQRTVAPPSPTPEPAPTPDPYCSPVTGPVIVRGTVRPIDPKVRRAVNRQWRRIERWLKANAPRTYRGLGRPGRARTIAIAEAQMGVHFPDDLRASLLRHDGAAGFGFGAWFDGASNLSVREIRDTWRHECRLDSTDRGDDPWGELWSGRLIPVLVFAGMEESSAYALVDSADGSVGWDDTISGMGPRRPSYHALMRAVADALEDGKDFDGWRPAVERGVLRWENVEQGDS
ncbi:SMI1/KNR4 family protein [Nonomuraea sp. NPDC049419]|uniref:SMI1/KNR4 family protein n=1 Tax=Nonomuraea sp. NPDC049419 TaxID=3155772 RepID=UPI00342997CD